MKNLTLVFLLTFSVSLFAVAQTAPVAEWIFQADYQLPGSAANYPGPRLQSPVSNFGKVGTLSYPLILKDEEPTERIVNFLSANELPGETFSIELWMANHVNQPIGMLATVKNRDINESPEWLLGYYGNELLFSMNETNAPYPAMLETTLDRGWKNYWMHIVATFDGEKARLFFNGELKGEMSISNWPGISENAEIELAAYMNNEPYMELANLLRAMRLYDAALSQKDVEASFRNWQEQAEQGTLYPEIFHFNAGPYLHYVTPTSINITWETDRPVQRAIVQYGEELPLQQEKVLERKNDLEIENSFFIETITLDGLSPSTPYFYNIVLTDESGETIESGVLTFATAPAGAPPFTFAVIGDTEARPHVNFQVSQQVWDERPNFMLNLGDLTDGGREHHKFEWNYEYFTGMRALNSRIPVFPVAGNGEGDLFWYNRYHKLPEPEGFYKFSYGDADFFMLDSNQRDDFAPGGKQYAWLEEQLQNSTARWKFVAHHHAPYSSDENDYGNSWEGKSNLGDPNIRKIVPLYEKYGVDIVFFGHLHTYQRTLPILENVVDKKNGVIYLQGGGGGGNLEDFTPTRSWFSAKTYRGHHYFVISVEGDELHLKMYDSDGGMKDFLNLKKE